MMRIQIRDAGWKKFGSGIDIPDPQQMTVFKRPIVCNNFFLGQTNVVWNKLDYGCGWTGSFWFCPMWSNLEDAQPKGWEMQVLLVSAMGLPDAAS
jgi:hypothetical protein